MVYGLEFLLNFTFKNLISLQMHTEVFFLNKITYIFTKSTIKSPNVCTKGKRINLHLCKRQYQSIYLKMCLWVIKPVPLCWSHGCVKGKRRLSFIHVCEHEGEQKKNEAIWPGKRNTAVMNTVSSDRISDMDCWDVITAKRRTETGRQMRKKSKKLWSGVSRSVILRGSHEAHLSLSHFREKVEKD